MKKLFWVTHHQAIMVYAENIEEAQFLFTENIYDSSNGNKLHTYWMA